MTTSTHGEIGHNLQDLESAIREKVAAMVGVASADIDPREPLQPLLLAAGTREGLLAAAAQVRAQVAETSGPLLLATVRAVMRQSCGHHRLAITAQARAELVEKLDGLLAGRSVAGMSSGVASARPPRIAFVFSPQGGQWSGMGRELMRTEPAFRAKLLACDEAIQRHSGWSVLAELNADIPGPRSGEVDRIQPVMFAVQVALAALWEAQGVRPEVVVGYSVGEIAAAHVAGILDLDEAARVVCVYSRIQAKTAGNGGMALVECTEDEAEARIAGFGERICIAGLNGVNSTLLSGEPDALDALLAGLRSDGIYGVRVKVNVAPHSPQMDPILPELRASLLAIRATRASVPMLSTCSGPYWRNGAYLHGLDVDGEYLARNLRQFVRFAPAVQRLLSEGIEYFVEISPHPVLQHTIQRCIAAHGSSARVLASARRDGERRANLETLGALFVAGADFSGARAGLARLGRRPGDASMGANGSV